MIEASIAAVPGLVVSFLILAVLLGLPTALVAKARGKPWPLRTALVVYLSGILAVTLLAGNAGLKPGQCDTGAPIHLLTSASSLLNIALFAPGAFLAVLLFRRPVTVATAFVLLSAAVELTQSLGNLGRACSATDFVANGTGAVFGAAVGAVWLYRRGRTTGKPVRDLVWGVALATVGALGVAGVFHERIKPVDVVAQDDRTHRLAESSVQANEWITVAAQGIFGSGTEVQQSETEKHGDRLRISVRTNRGKISGWWPDKTLESAWSSNTRGDEGNLDENQVAAAADKFARRWFADDVAGSKRAVRSIGDGSTRAYTVTYRRYVNGVMMPMRLNLTITTTARVMGFTARTIEDPELAKVTVDETKARSIAKQKTGRTAEAALLLAQKVSDAWRPVWIVGSGKSDVSVDAATGTVIADTEIPGNPN
ncbi:VanZ family protein [Streptomyces sp. NPDC059629]|uniref:VanZ family protein n=1 Tax=Streptomyces sp. NPDC059629 TaxID=3346889 RepID=UPI00369A2CF1